MATACEGCRRAFRASSDEKKFFQETQNGPETGQKRSGARVSASRQLTAARIDTDRYSDPNSVIAAKPCLRAWDAPRRTSAAIPTKPA